MLKRIEIFGIKTTLTETRNFSALVAQISNNPNQSMFFCNVHMLMLAQEDQVLAEAMNGADLVFADSAPIAWLQRRISGENAKYIPGYKIMFAIFERAVKNNENVGFLGSTPDVMQQLVRSLSDRFKGLPVTYQYSPPFMQGELVLTEQELQSLIRSDVKWLFVGLGCPKQEKWIHKYHNEIQCNILGVGAAFDWLSELTTKPPEWMEKYGLAWLFRFFQSPTRMFHRYLKYNTKFVLRVLKLTIFGK